MVLAETEGGRRWRSAAAPTGALVAKLHVALAQAQHRTPTNVNYPAGDRRPDRRWPRHRDDAPPRRWNCCGGPAFRVRRANYLVWGRFAFGDLSLAESTRSLELFQRHIMPEAARERAWVRMAE